MALYRRENRIGNNKFTDELFKEGKQRLNLSGCEVCRIYTLSALSDHEIFPKYPLRSDVPLYLRTSQNSLSLPQGPCGTKSTAGIIMPKTPESEILAKCFADMAGKSSEILAKNFADFRRSISSKSHCGRKKFHGKSSANSTSQETKFFHGETLGAWAHKQ